MPLRPCSLMEPDRPDGHTDMTAWISAPRVWSHLQYSGAGLSVGPPVAHRHKNIRRRTCVAARALCQAGSGRRSWSYLQCVKQEQAARWLLSASPIDSVEAKIGESISWNRLKQPINFSK